MSRNFFLVIFSIISKSTIVNFAFFAWIIENNLLNGTQNLVLWEFFGSNNAWIKKWPRVKWSYNYSYMPWRDYILRHKLDWRRFPWHFFWNYFSISFLQLHCVIISHWLTVMKHKMPNSKKKRKIHDATHDLEKVQNNWESHSF